MAHTHQTELISTYPVPAGKAGTFEVTGHDFVRVEPRFEGVVVGWESPSDRAVVARKIGSVINKDSEVRHVHGGHLSRLRLPQIAFGMRLGRLDSLELIRVDYDDEYTVVWEQGNLGKRSEIGVHAYSLECAGVVMKKLGEASLFDLVPEMYAQLEDERSQG